jgi:hypothetical protein
MILHECQGIAEWSHPQVLDVLIRYADSPSVWLQITTAARRSDITPRHLKLALEQLRRERAQEVRLAYLKRIN